MKNKWLKTNKIRKNEVSILKYLFITLFKNKTIISVSVMNILLLLTVPILLLNLNGEHINNFKKYSWINIGLPFILSLIYVAMSSVVLFIKTKTNNVDLFFSILPISDLKILFYKYFTIIISSLYILLIQIIVSIIQVIEGVPAQTSILVLLAMMFSLVMMNILWIVVFSAISINTKYLMGLITILITTFLLILGFLTPIISQSSFISSNDFNSYKYKRNIVKVFSLNDTGKVVKMQYAIYENPTGISDRENQLWKPSNISKYSPFSILTGFSNDALKNTIEYKISDNQIMKLNNKFSINYNQINIKNFNEIEKYKNIVLTSVNEKTIFEFDNKEELFEEITKLLISNKKIFSKIKDEKYWKLFLSELNKQHNWNSMSISDKNIISHLVGVDTTNSILYTIFNKYDLLFKRYLSGIQKYISKNTTNSFGKLMTYLWSNQTTKFNVFSYKNIGNYNEIYKFHPNINAYDKFKKANQYDIEYIKSIFFNSYEKQGSLKLQALGQDSVYYDIDNLTSIFGQKIKNKKEVDDYIDSHSTINNLQELIRRVDNSSKNKIQKVAFRNNIPNNLILNKKTNVVTYSKTPINLIYLFIFIIIIVGLQVQINKRIQQGDMK